MARTKKTPVAANKDHPPRPRQPAQIPPVQSEAQIMRGLMKEKPQPAKPTTMDLDEEKDTKSFPLSAIHKTRLSDQPGVKAGRKLLDGVGPPMYKSYEENRVGIEKHTKFFVGSQYLPGPQILESDVRGSGQFIHSVPNQNADLQPHEQENFHVEESDLRGDGMVPKYSPDDTLEAIRAKEEVESRAEGSRQQEVVQPEVAPLSKDCEAGDQSQKKDKPQEKGKPATAPKPVAPAPAPLPQSQFYPTRLGNPFKLPTPKDKEDPIKAVNASSKRYAKQIGKDLDEKYKPKFGKTPFVMNDLSPKEKRSMKATFHIKTEEELESILAKTDPVTFLIARLKAEEKSAMMDRYGLTSDEALRNFIFCHKYVSPELNVGNWGKDLMEEDKPTSEPQKEGNKPASGSLKEGNKATSEDPKESTTKPAMPRLPFPSEENQWAGEYQEIADAMAAKNDDANMSLLEAAVAKPKFVVPAAFPEAPKLRRRRVKAPAVKASDRKTRSKGVAKPQTSVVAQQAPIASAVAQPSQAPPVAQAPVPSSASAAIPGINLPGNNNSTAVQGQSGTLTPKRKRLAVEVPGSDEEPEENLEAMELPKGRNVKSIARASKRQKVQEEIPSPPEKTQTPPKKQSKSLVSPPATSSPIAGTNVEAASRVQAHEEQSDSIPSPDDDSESSSSEPMASTEKSKRKREQQPLSSPDEDESPAKKVKVATIASSSAPATPPQDGRTIIKFLVDGRYPTSPSAMKAQIAAMQGTKRKTPDEEEEQPMGHSARSKRVQIRLRTHSQTIQSVNSSAPMPPDEELRPMGRPAGFKRYQIRLRTHSQTIPSINSSAPMPPDEEVRPMRRPAGFKRFQIRLPTLSQTISSVNSSAPMPPPNPVPQEKVVDDSEGEEAIEADDEVQAQLIAVPPVPVANPPTQQKGRDTGLNGGHWSAPVAQKRERKKRVLEPEDDEAEAPSSKRTMKQKETAVASKKSVLAPTKSQGKAPKKGSKPKKAAIPQPQVGQAPQPQVQNALQPVDADESSSDPGDDWD
ncbi:hypothetical protein HYFRA_00013887 [Hymenoscyphus fraxineus]|uniref:Uncharacterized protein n=1 Tax=Hymenoscyphus fraxineus TaxID=746836 RepID=A0A9N9LDE6_9HELO|nr:hypothetical protein HYFRA_00013887 [Hymenoscyphus fraxineus]